MPYLPIQQHVRQWTEVEHEENWVQLSLRAYVQLWAARKLALTLPYPWERYLPDLPQKSDTVLSPSLVQRDMNRIITPPIAV